MSTSSSKNWDKPLDSDRMYVSTLNRHHSVNWDAPTWKAKVGYAGPYDNEVFYYRYIKYCKIAETPLMKALE